MLFSLKDVRIAYDCPDCNKTQYEDLVEVLSLCCQPQCDKCSELMRATQVDVNTRNLKGDSVAEILSTFVNDFCMKEEPFIDKIMREHRTLQQNMFRMFYHCIERWAKEFSDNRYDLRNEATVKACFSITRLFHPEGIAIPFV